MYYDLSELGDKTTFKKGNLQMTDIKTIKPELFESPYDVVKLRFLSSDAEKTKSNIESIEEFLKTYYDQWHELLGEDETKLSSNDQIVSGFQKLEKEGFVFEIADNIYLLTKDIVERYPQLTKEAYLFLKVGLDYSIKEYEIGCESKMYEKNAGYLAHIYEGLEAIMKANADYIGPALQTFERALSSDMNDERCYSNASCALHEMAFLYPADRRAFASVQDYLEERRRKLFHGQKTDNAPHNEDTMTGPVFPDLSVQVDGSRSFQDPHPTSSASQAAHEDTMTGPVPPIKMNLPEKGVPPLKVIIESVKSLFKGC